MTGFLFDTNIVSELVKPRPNVKVVQWVDSISEDLIYLSVLTIGEIRKRIQKLPTSKRRAVLEQWLQEELRVRFDGRILPITERVADRWGNISADAEMAKQLLPVIDGLLAATAQEHNLTFVTRNSKDIHLTGVRSFNPWDESE